MVFGKKKKTKYEEMESEEEEGNDEDKEQEEEDDSEKRESELKRLNSELKSLKQDKPKPLARIVAGEIIGEGVYKYTLVTNKIIGQLGEEFEI